MTMWQWHEDNRFNMLCQHQLFYNHSNIPEWDKFPNLDTRGLRWLYKNAMRSNVLIATVTHLCVKASSAFMWWAVPTPSRQAAEQLAPAVSNRKGKCFLTSQTSCTAWIPRLRCNIGPRRFKGLTYMCSIQTSLLMNEHAKTVPGPARRNCCSLKDKCLSHQECYFCTWVTPHATWNLSCCHANICDC